eukprot:2888012-Karenia_brevis.AAC.1
MDPKLARRDSTYGKFLGDLYKHGQLEMAEFDVEVTPFFVERKDGRQRLIFDTRAANMHFEEPPYVSLASGEALARLETRKGVRLHKLQGD